MTDLFKTDVTMLLVNIRSLLKNSAELQATVRLMHQKPDIISSTRRGWIGALQRYHWKDTCALPAQTAAMARNVEESRRMHATP